MTNDDRTYNVHGRLLVHIDATVEPRIRKAVEFQLGGLAVSADMETEADRTDAPRITVRDIRCFDAEDAGHTVEFHTGHGAEGSWYHDPEHDLAVVRRSDGLDVYAARDNFVINPFVNHLLLGQGVGMVHAAGVVDGNGRAILLPGAGGVGKTLLSGILVKEHGYRHLGDDLVLVVREGHCLSFPRAVVLKRGHESVFTDELGKPRQNRLRESRPWASARRFVLENAPLMGLTRSVLQATGARHRVSHWLHGAPYRETVPVNDLYGEEGLASEGALNTVVYLQRADDGEMVAEKTDPERLVRRMQNVLLHEWVDYLRQVLALSAMDVVDLAWDVERTGDVLRSALASAENWTLRIPPGVAPREAAREILQLSGASL